MILYILRYDNRFLERSRTGKDSTNMWKNNIPQAMQSIPWSWIDYLQYLLQNNHRVRTNNTRLQCIPWSNNLLTSFWVPSGHLGFLRKCKSNVKTAHPQKKRGCLLLFFAYVGQDVHILQAKFLQMISLENTKQLCKRSCFLPLKQTWCFVL